MENKFKLSDPSVEEVDEFKKKVEEVLKKLSLVLNLEVVKVPVSNKLENGQVNVGFMDIAQMKLQKRVEQVEAEIVSPIQVEDIK
jgi:hypothetical protein